MSLKHFASVTLLAFALFASLVVSVTAQDKHSGKAKHGSEHEKSKHTFGVSQFDAFHDILHPLQHEALPNNDFKTIRAKASDLIASGHSLVKLGAPKGVKQPDEYKAGLKKFQTALEQYEKDAKADDDERLRTSYTAVHDTFEELVDLLPRKAQH